MLFFCVDSTISGLKKEYFNEDGEMRRPARRTTADMTDSFNRDLGGKAGCFVEEMQTDHVGIVVLTEDKDPLPLAGRFVRYLGLTPGATVCEEIDFATLCVHALSADRNDLLSDADDFCRALHLHLFRHPEIPFGEGILEGRSYRELTRAMRDCLVSEQMTPEIDRIRQGRKMPGVKGHPVHYMLYTDNPDQRREMARILLDALYVNGRITNRRFGFYNMEEGGRSLINDLQYLYSINRGGAVLVRFQGENGIDDGEYAGSDRRGVEILAKMIEKYRHDVLTVLCLPLAAKNLRQMVLENIPTVTMVEIREDSVDGAAARRYLRRLADEAHLTPDKTLYAALKECHSCTASSIRRVFGTWCTQAMKTIVYPQYRELVPAGTVGLREKPTGTAFDKLNAMIGLSEAKAVIRRAVNYFKYRAILSGREIRVRQPALHMCFTGNPGTAKTTVARLVAQILTENDILPTGVFVELGRSDLVAKYVGWTADTVKKRFREAKGGVLFIDEAYSLVDDRSGSFGDEAINTIVQEMENHREDVVVIFAGYPDKMEEFLGKNPGLRSRIAFHVPFPDYDTQELVEIAEKIAGENGCRFSDAALGKLAGLFDRLRVSEDFGNGRCARNMVESAQMHLADRLARLGCENFSDEVLGTILPEDLEMPPLAGNLPLRRVGFAV